MNANVSDRSNDREPKTKVRQGVTGHNVRYVLMLSLGISAAALILIYLYFA